MLLLLLLVVVVIIGIAQRVEFGRRAVRELTAVHGGDGRRYGRDVHVERLVGVRHGTSVVVIEQIVSNRMRRRRNYGVEGGLFGVGRWQRLRAAVQVGGRREKRFAQLEVALAYAVNDRHAEEYEQRENAHAYAHYESDRNA